ncbi:MAG: hypothetical protein ABI592_11250 [Acidobacteriota bacterium]
MFDVAKTYRVPVAAPAAVVYDSIEGYDFRASRMVRLLMALRGYRRLPGPAKPAGLIPSLTARGFVPLGGRPGRELVFGLAGKFWTPSGGLRPLSAAEFEAFDEEGCAKAAWNVTVEAVGGEASMLSTETRVRCYGAGARRRFRIYWSTIEIFSGIIRMAMLRGIRDRALSRRSP